MTTHRGEDPAALLPEGEDWFTQPAPRFPGDDAPESASVPDGAPGRPMGGATRITPAPGRADGVPAAAPDGRPAGPGHAWVAQDASEGEKQLAARTDGFDPADTGTWRVRDVVPGADGGRRHTTILRYLLGLIAVDHVRTLTRWTFAVPVVGLLLLLVRPRWIGAAVLVLGVLLVIGRVLAVRLIARRSLARRYRPVEDELRAAVEAGKANLRSELDRVGLPTSKWTLPAAALRMDRGSDRSVARGKLREVEIHRILPEAQLQRALRVLDEAGPAAR